MVETSNQSEVETIYMRWDEALSKNDVDGLMALYAPDATIESPLIPHVMGQERGICEGADEIRSFFEQVAERKPEIRQYHRRRYFTDGKTLMWEYPRQTPQGEQMDFVEVMELEAGRIKKHRVYWGWFGVGVMQRDEYH